MRARGDGFCVPNPIFVSIYSSFFPGTFSTSKMDSGQKSTGTAAAAARRKGKVGNGLAASSIGRGSSSASGLLPARRGSGPTAGVHHVRRASGPAAGFLPVDRGSGPTALPFAINGSNNAAPTLSSSMAAFGAGESSPIGGFNSHGGGGLDGSTTSSPAGFLFPPSPSQAWWGSDGSDPTWDNHSHSPGGFMGILNGKSNLHLGGSLSHYAPLKDASSSPDVEILADNQAVEVDNDDKNVRTEKRIMWTPQEDERLMSDWIEHSTDSAVGADRKGEAYWSR